MNLPAEDPPGARVGLVAGRRRETLFEAFVSAAETFGRSAPILEDVKGPVQSYGALLRSSLALGRWVSGFTAPGEAVGILLPNLAATVSLFLGVVAAGRAAAMLNYTAGTAGLESACVAARLRTVITSHQFIEAANLGEALRGLAGVRLVFLEDFRSQFGLGDKLWLLARALRRPRRAFGAVDPGAQAVILFTSGSEDRPKGVALSHDAILANIAQIRSVMDFGPQDRFLSVLPLYHAYGLTGCTLLPLLIGAGIYLFTSPLRYHEIPQLARRQKVTCVFGTGAFLGQYARHAQPGDFATVRYAISGGEKLQEDTRRIWLEKFGLEVLEGYGVTECAPVLSLNTPAAFRVAAVGHFLPGIEHRLEPVPQIPRGGVLHVRGPNNMLGYYLYGAPGVLQPPASLMGEGWHRTGDVVEVDGDGFVFVVGRVKRFAKIAGEMVSLEVVEKIAAAASPGERHAATLCSDPLRGEAIVLFSTDPALNRIPLARAARQLGAPALAVAHEVVHLPELPMLGSGKTDYVSLGQMAAGLPECPARQGEGEAV